MHAERTSVNEPTIGVLQLGLTLTCGPGFFGGSMLTALLAASQSRPSLDLPLLQTGAHVTIPSDISDIETPHLHSG